MLQGNKLITTILCLAGFSFSLFGYDQGLFGGILASARFKDLIGNPDTTRTGLVTAVYDLGCAFGAVSAFVASEKLGRKRSIFIGLSTLIVGAIIQTTSFGYGQMVAGRLIGGLGVGLMTVTIPIYQSETLPADRRGALFVVQSFFIIFGVMVASWLTLGCIFINNSAGWRFPVAFQSSFAIVALFILPVVPETPRWLENHGFHQEAVQSLSRILGKGPEDPETKKEMAEIIDGIELERKVGSAGWAETFRGQNLQRALLGMGPYLMNQWSGINSISYYQAPLYENVLGFSPTIALVLAGAATTLYCITSALPYFYIDKIGRRNTIMFGAAACSVCMTVIAGTVSPHTKAAGGAAVAFIFLYQDFFGMGILPVSWSYAAEISPLRIRAKSNAVGVFSHWMSNFVVVMITPIGTANLDYKFFIIWACILASFVPIIYFLYPETARKSLEEMDRQFLERPGLLQGILDGGANARIGNGEGLVSGATDSESKKTKSMA